MKKKNEGTLCPHVSWTYMFNNFVSIAQVACTRLYEAQTTFNSFFFFFFLIFRSVMITRGPLSRRKNRPCLIKRRASLVFFLLGDGHKKLTHDTNQWSRINFKTYVLNGYEFIFKAQDTCWNFSELEFLLYPCVQDVSVGAKKTSTCQIHLLHSSFFFFLTWISNSVAFLFPLIPTHHLAKTRR